MRRFLNATVLASLLLCFYSSSSWAWGGKVYVYNFIHSPASIFVNGYSAGELDGWQDGPVAPVTMPRSKRMEPMPSFAIGDNMVRLNLDGYSLTANVTVPSPVEEPVSLDDDLTLILYFDKAVLSSRGRVYDISEVYWRR